MKFVTPFAKLRLAIACSSVAAVTAGCSLINPPSDQHVSGEWLRHNQVFLDKEPDMQSAGTKTMLLFYRAAATKAANAKPVNLYINHDYVASLLPGGYTIVKTCVGNLEVSAAESDVTHAYATKEFKGIQLNAEGSAGKYFEVIVNDGEVGVGEQSDADFAKATNLKLQVHTIQRVKKLACPVPTPTEPIPAMPPVAPPVAETPPPQPPTAHTEEKLITRVQFNFSKSDLVNIFPDSLEQLDQLALLVGDGFKTVKSIDIEGHTDAVGNAASNHALALRRAKTVARYLTDAKLDPSVMRIQALGAEDLVVRDCPAAPIMARDACNRFNRRVEVTIRGELK